MTPLEEEILEAFAAAATGKDIPAELTQSIIDLYAQERLPAPDAILETIRVAVEGTIL